MKERPPDARVIMTVTLNPAIDEAVAIEQLTLGGTNRCQLDALDPGGKGLNASRVIKRLGRETVALGFVGGVTGEMVQSRLDLEGVCHDFDDVGGLTRLNVMVFERSTGRRTRLYLPGPWIAPTKLTDLKRRLDQVPANGIVILAGSVPPGLSPQVYRDMVVALKARGARPIVDVSGEALEAVLAAGPVLIKPNVEEAAEVLGHPLLSDEAVLRAARELRAAGAENVVISQGADGAIGVGPDGEWKAVPPPVTARSTVGSGDSMVAGLAIAFNEDMGLEYGLRLGTATGAATAIIPGTSLCERQDVERFISQVTVHRLSELTPDSTNQF